MSTPAPTPAATATVASKATKKKADALLPDAPKPWAVVKPGGLHVLPEAITLETRNALWKFFHPLDGELEGDVADRTRKPRDGEFEWAQRFKRFPKTAHHNGWHTGKFPGEAGAAEFEAKFPEVFKAATEAVAHARGADITDVPGLAAFRPESVAVMRHLPGWGLGTHYDNAADEGKGTVLMLSLSNDDTVPRTFQFTDPPNGRKFPVETKDRQLVVFGGEAYDLFMHESLHNPKQSGETISLTIRLADICGSGTTVGTYGTGAPAAKRVAHARIAAKRAAAKAAVAPYKRILPSADDWMAYRAAKRAAPPGAAVRRPRPEWVRAADGSCWYA